MNQSLKRLITFTTTLVFLMVLCSTTRIAHAEDHTTARLHTVLLKTYNTIAQPWTTGRTYTLKNKLDNSLEYVLVNVETGVYTHDKIPEGEYFLYDSAETNYVESLDVKNQKTVKRIYYVPFMLFGVNGVTPSSGAGVHPIGSVVDVTASLSTGYDFDAWYVAGSNDSVSTTKDFEHPVLFPTALSGYGKVKTYTLKYIDLGAAPDSSKEETHTWKERFHLTSAAEIFSKTGYHFRGWSSYQLGAEQGIVEYSDKENILGPLAYPSDETRTWNLYAVWAPNNYKVIFNNNGGSGIMPTMNCQYDTQYALQANTFTKDDNVFLGWSTNPADTSTMYQDEEGIRNLTSEHNAMVTLYAIWKPNDIIVSFSATKDGQSIADMRVCIGNQLNQPVEGFWPTEIDVPTNQMFIGWSSSSGENVQIIQKNGSDVVTASNNIILTPVFSERALVYKYTVNNNVWGSVTRGMEIVRENQSPQRDPRTICYLVSKKSCYSYL